MRAPPKPLVLGLLLIELAVLGAGATVAATRNPKHVVKTVSIPKHLVRVTMAQGCPRKITGFDGVYNPKARDVASSLIPPGATGGLICRYSPVQGEQGPTVLHGALYSSVFISGAAAQRLASELNRIPPFRPGVRHCPIDVARHDVLVFGYARRADVDLWYASTGCQSLSNGYVVRGENSPALASFITDIDRLAPPVLTLRRK